MSDVSLTIFEKVLIFWAVLEAVFLLPAATSESDTAVSVLLWSMIALTVVSVGYFVFFVI